MNIVEKQYEKSTITGNLSLELKHIIAYMYVLIGDIPVKVHVRRFVMRCR